MAPAVSRVKSQTLAAVLASDAGARAMATKMLFAEDIATMGGVSVQAAREWLANWETSHGTSVVGRVGNQRWTTLAALESIGPTWMRQDDTLRARVEALESEIDSIRLTLVELSGGRESKRKQPHPKSTR